MKIDVKKVAKLANLSIKEEDLPKFEKQLNEIVGYIDKLNEADTKDVPITSQVTGLENVTRADTTTPALTQEEALSGTKDKNNGFFKVPAILAEE
ncbi:MAG TPA: Asp-tRNA(Asn)/Glu-tRNA(Gln) amidotransferase subunit GatC [Patescibacteria group bacterium]|nr:Asp-tRNA(Asn)/Glu-tRNA(Gln) amidotransferase subunit GatC [Patescibacteria group bacterium]